MKDSIANIKSVESKRECLIKGQSPLLQHNYTRMFWGNRCRD